MNKLNINKKFICLFLSELFEILVLFIKVKKSQGTIVLNIMIILAIGLYIFGLKKNKDYGFKVVGESIFPYFLIYTTLSQLLYALFHYNLLGTILSVPAIIMAVIALMIFLKKSGMKK